MIDIEVIWGGFFELHMLYDGMPVGINANFVVKFWNQDDVFESADDMFDRMSIKASFPKFMQHVSFTVYERIYFLVGAVLGRTTWSNFSPSA